MQRPISNLARIAALVAVSFTTLVSLVVLWTDTHEDFKVRALGDAARAEGKRSARKNAPLAVHDVVVPSNGNQRRRRSRGALAWLNNRTNVPSCGSWPSNSTARYAHEVLQVETAALGWACVAYRESHLMSRRDLRRGEKLTPEICARWCESAHDPSLALEGSWCCQWRGAGANGGSGECEWTDGVSTIVNRVDAAPTSSALAYEACSLEGQFVLFADGCVRDDRGHLGDVLAIDANDCALQCEAVPDCEFFGYAAASGNRSARGDEQLKCELRQNCTISEVPRTQAIDFYARASTAIGLAPFLNAAAADEGPTMVELDDTETAVLRPSGWPTQVGLALGRVVDPGRDMRHNDARGHHDGRHLVGALACGAIGATNATRVADAMLFESDYVGSCAQICLPLEYLSVALENGVLRGWCADNGCATYALTRKYGDISYDLFDCACPTSNASALYACEPSA